MTYEPCTLRGVCQTLDGRAATGRLVIRPALEPPVIRESGVLVASGPLVLDLVDQGDDGLWEVEVPPNDDATLTNFEVPYVVTEQLDHQVPREWRSFVVTLAPSAGVVETSSLEGGVVNLNVGAANGVPSGPTADRPVVVGGGSAHYFDSTLGVPIWWNGALWVDAAGLAV